MWSSVTLIAIQNSTIFPSVCAWEDILSDKIYLVCTWDCKFLLDWTWGTSYPYIINPQSNNSYLLLLDNRRPGVLVRNLPSSQAISWLRQLQVAVSFCWIELACPYIVNPQSYYNSTFCSVCRPTRSPPLEINLILFFLNIKVNLINNFFFY